MSQEKIIRIFIVEDDSRLGERMREFLPGEQFCVDVFTEAREVLEAVAKNEYDAGFVDARMPDMDGIELVKQLREKQFPAKLIMLNDQASISAAVEAMRLGCYDYLTKPVQLDEIEALLHKVCAVTSPDTGGFLSHEHADTWLQRHGFISRNPRMLGIYAMIEKVAKTASPVLIMGESGTGKELVARAIHRSSDRNDKTFIIIDCAALSDTLLENELFGHEKGAYTDATSAKRGLFEVADGGTLFIDEIGEMKLSTQMKLLRVIETQRFRRLGGTQETKVDVRIIAATNRNLLEEVKQGNFRKDLYYRLNVFNINLPPLRERKEDIPLLIKHFIETSPLNAAARKRMREEDMKTLAAYDWPGNVRELHHFVEHAIIAAPNEYITPADFPDEFNAQDRASLDHDAVPLDRGLEELLAEYEKKVILSALKECKNNRLAVAKKLGISRAKLYREIKRLSLPDNPDSPSDANPPVRK